MGMPRDSRARGLMGLAVVLLGTTLPCLGAPAADGAKNTPSPGSYRVPRWIEEIGTADQPAAPRMTPLRQTQPFGTAAAPLPGTVPQTLAPVAAKPLTIAATPAADSDGKPGRALLRSRNLSTFQPTPDVLQTKTSAAAGFNKTDTQAKIQCRPRRGP